MNEDTFIRPDASGVRKGLERPQMQAGDDYPYDRQVNYGQPADYDRGSGGGVGGLHHPLTARDADKSAWDDLEEAMGTPMFFQKAYSSQRGSPAGTATVGWSHPPSKPWDENEKDDFDESFDGRQFPPEPIRLHLPPADSHDVLSHEDIHDLDLLLISVDSSLHGDNEQVTDILSNPSVWPFLERALLSLKIR